MSDVKNIANILPEGLDESTVEAIFKLVDSTINEQVEEKVGLLEAKVTAYLRTKVDQLKEQALAELSEENEVFRNARLFESVRTLMALELTNDDEDNALSEMTNQHGELQEEFDVLTEQLNSLVVENEKLQNSVRIQADKISLSENTVSYLETEKEQLLDEVENLKASNDENFFSSEKAIVVSNVEEEIIENKRTPSQNEFLNDEVMKFMPFTSPN
jgi:septal ring factor EnvC (AmiA/AmiB activator)